MSVNAARTFFEEESPSNIRKPNMIEAVYTLQASEFIEGQKLWCPAAVKKLPGYWTLQVISVIFGVFVGLGFPQLPKSLAIGQAVSLLAIMLFQAWRKRAIRSQQFERMKDQFDEVSVRIDDEGYHDNKAGACGGWIAWKGFTGWRETSRIFILGRGLTFVTIPKRPFSVKQQDSLREMFRSKILATQ